MGEEGPHETSMQIVTQELGALVATVTVKDSKVADRYLRINAQVLYALVWILHPLPLANIADHTCVEALHLEFERADPKGVIWFQHKLLVLLQAAVDPTRLVRVDAAVIDQQGAENRVIDNLEVILNDPITAKRHILYIRSAN